ncbi:MAG: hypothetical protein WAU44_16340 [Nitrospira sp.]|uniref:hypothetical protein n=1 Tax=Nitrospira sp. ND1 TaxID=1658518 RepID=UPI0013565174|nr:hypothetical protein [Nitrospira sp. ND1]MBK7421387.1 hypothetical protein [Nitrospira sp.]MBK7487650.1 hypothetical protein [Nitrospira sp.]MBK8380092.1 hypothetical protein [Nitrospira sp.]MBP6205746.1 hypothetical protein [Nitrospira sp.]MBP7361433.1 hypothetical protein [Nitrospira sp.]
MMVPGPEPTQHRGPTFASMIAPGNRILLQQMSGDDPVDSELTVRIHFRTLQQMG